MGTDSKESSQSLRENKREQISKKVWDIEEKKPIVQKVNTDGSVPYDLQRKIKENVLYPTTYINSEGKRQFLIKINGYIHKLNI